MAQKKNLKQKLAVAMSVVNALNVGAAVALPYANMTQSIVADGAKIERLVDGVAGAMYGTAHAEHITSTITAGKELDGTLLGEVTDGVITVEAGGQTSKTTLGGTDTTSGVEIVHNGGTAKDTTTNPGGVLELHSGARLRVNDITDIEYNQYVLNGGTLRLVDGASIDTYTINNGTLELGAGGKATNTVVKASADGTTHGVELVNGGTSLNAVVQDGGTQIVKAGTATGATLSGGVQEISGGTVTGTTVNGGTQHILGGATASEITMAGGTVRVEDNATAKIAAATSGTLELRETGGATAEFGNATTVANFTLTNLNTSNDTVILGMGNDATAVVGKNLTIETMTGNAKFLVNTDLSNNKSDTITINKVTGAASSNTISINYDRTAPDQLPKTYKALVATSKDGKASFTGAAGPYGGYNFVPTLLQEGTNWYITGAENAGPSEQMYASVDTATWQAIAWRDSNFVIGSRMTQLHHNPESAHQNDFWVDFTRGRNRTNNFGHAMNRTYDRVSVGYDRLVGHGWTVGLAYGYEKGTEGYEKGSGDSTGNVVTAYATWQGANGNYVDMTIKGGQLESDFTVQDDNQVTPSKADTRATGAGVSAVFGHRFENASAFYVEPHAGFYWSHLGGYDYRLSDGSDVNVDGCNSFVGNLGVNIGKHLGKGEVYARADFMHDFSGNVRVSMTKAGLNNTMENPLHDSWLNVAVGYRQNYDRVGWYAEAGCQSIGSRESSGDWVWKAGVEFKF